MIEASEHHKEGRLQAERYYKSQAFASLSRFIEARDALKLFYPAETEYMTQVSSPMPKWRTEWMQGFKERQAEILEELGLSIESWET